MSNHENFSEVLERAMTMLKDHGYNFKQDVICMDLMNADVCNDAQRTWKRYAEKALKEFHEYDEQEAV